MAFYIAAGAFAVLQFLAENPSVRLAIEEEAALLGQRLSAKARAAWPSGPHLEFETVLQDVAAANALLARLAERHAAAAGARGRIWCRSARAGLPRRVRQGASAHPE
jgi:hypothetical protein